MNSQNQQQAIVIQEQQEREMDRMHGTQHRGDRFIQPLHHHNFTTNHKPHSRDKLRRA